MDVRTPLLLTLSAALLLLSAGQHAGAQQYAADTFLFSGNRPEPDTYQWYLPAIGMDKAMLKSLAQDDALQPVIVAVIDTGLDYDHPDISMSNIWRNTAETVNAVDDDGNGYIDDVMGWDFIDNNNDPWDWVGHGTHVAGIIAATPGNRQGISGINPKAVIMPLRAMNSIGRGASSRIAQAIYYAVDNGAKVINLSLAVESVSALEEKAITYALNSGVAVVVAAGNDRREANAYTPARVPGVLTVAATAQDGESAAYSNWGSVISLAAPGTDIISLRAANTDFMLELTEIEVKPLQYAYGASTEYYLATGTSFAAPIVSGVASLLLSRSPALGAAAVQRILQHSATDTGPPGIDFYTGYGLLNVPAALEADPEHFIAAAIDGVELHSEGKEHFLKVMGTASADQFKEAIIQLGKGEHPTRWRATASPLGKRVEKGVLGLIPQKDVMGSKSWDDTTYCGAQRRLNPGGQVATQSGLSGIFGQGNFGAVTCSSRPVSSERARATGRATRFSLASLLVLTMNALRPCCGPTAMRGDVRRQEVTKIPIKSGLKPNRGDPKTQYRQVDMRRW